MNNLLLENYNELKLLRPEDWWDMIPKGFKFHTTPWKHQVLATACNMANDSFLQALDMGTGKTKIIIDSLRYYKSINKPVRGLVVCLNSAVENWVEEFETHSTEIRSITIKEGCRKQRIRDLMETPADMRVISFEALRSLCCKREPDIGQLTPKGKQKYREVIDRKFINSLISALRPTAIVIDESHKVKNFKAKIFGVLKYISAKTPHRYLLTGTPFHNLLDVWAQYYLLDFGETFGTSFWSFKKTYFEEKTEYYYGAPVSNWEITDEGKANIERLMWRRAIRFTEDECQDLPPKVFIKKEYQLTKEQWKWYENVIKGDTEGKLMAKRQICSGFLYREGKIFKDNPKLEMLADLLGIIVEKDKAVIFHEFIEEARMIEDLLKRAKIKSISLNGRQKNNFNNSKKFQTEESIRVCIAHPLSGGASINLHRARYCINFSNGYSVIDWKQKIKRIHRGEIKRKRIYYDLVGKGTVEVGMYWGLRNEINVFDSVMNGKLSFSDLAAGKIPEGSRTPGV